MNKLRKIKDEIVPLIERTETESEIENIRIKYLGRKGIIKEVLKSLKDVPPDKRPLLGKDVNEIKKYILDLINTRKKEIKYTQNKDYRRKREN